MRKHATSNKNVMSQISEKFTFILMRIYQNIKAYLLAKVCHISKAKAIR